MHFVVLMGSCFRRKRSQDFSKRSSIAMSCGVELISSFNVCSGIDISANEFSFCSGSVVGICVWLDLGVGMARGSSSLVNHGIAVTTSAGAGLA